MLTWLPEMLAALLGALPTLTGLLLSKLARHLAPPPADSCQTEEFHEQWKLKARDVLARSEWRRRKLTKRVSAPRAEVGAWRRFG